MTNLAASQPRYPASLPARACKVWLASRALLASVLILGQKWFFEIKSWEIFQKQYALRLKPSDGFLEVFLVLFFLFHLSRTQMCIGQREANQRQPPWPVRCRLRVFFSLCLPVLGSTTSSPSSRFVLITTVIIWAILSRFLAWKGDHCVKHSLKGFFGALSGWVWISSRGPCFLGLITISCRWIQFDLCFFGHLGLRNVFMATLAAWECHPGIRERMVELENRKDMSMHWCPNTVAKQKHLLCDVLAWQSVLAWQFQIHQDPTRG